MNDTRAETAPRQTSGWHLGINLGHDRAAALVRNGEIRVAIHQERLDRIKHSVGTLYQSPRDSRHVQLPGEAIRYCLDQCGIDWADLATVTANMPGLDHGPEILERVLPASLRGRIRRVPGHHLAHAYSAWWPSGFDSALVLVADATGSATAEGTESYSLYRADGNGLQLLHGERVSSHLVALSTLGFVYEYVTRKAGFVTETAPGLFIPEAGKLMGLAPYGGPQPDWAPWIETRAGDYGLRISAYDCFLQIAALEKRYDDGRGKPYLRPWLVDLAYKVQRELEQALLHLVGLGLRETGLHHLCLAGGVALNSVANYRLQRELDLEGVFVFPAAGDAGIAAGCALWACATQEAGADRRPLRRASLGRAYDGREIDAALARFADRIEVKRLDPRATVERTAEALAAGHIVARFQGGSEFGPRALGHRSILADPTFEHMRDIINARVKFRERFRPFAPVIPEEDVAQVFEQHTPSPFMLLVAAIRPEYRARIPSVTHCDGSGRIQTVTRDDNPWMHALCRRLPALHEGPPVVLNTSFNVAGQPIVETPEEAIGTFLAADIDYLALEDRWIAKHGVPVLGYREHLARVQDSPLPRGLAPGQPAPDDLMRQLDRALFFGETESCPWTAEELRRLSAEGGRLKETGLRFADNPFGRPFHTRLSGRALLLLDPLGRSQLLDLTGVRQPLECNLERVRLFLALLDDRGEESLDALRRELGATTGAWEGRCNAALGQLRGFGLAPRHAPPPLPPDDPLPTATGATLAPFAAPSFAQWELLGGLRGRLRGAGYRERAICHALGVESLQRIEPTRLHYYDRYQLPREDPLADLVRLFLLRTALPRKRLEALFGAGATAALARLGLLIPRGADWASRVDLYCVDGLYIATDHRYMLLEEDRFDEEPVMYIGLDSLGLVCTAPRPPVQRLLDLCTGSGVQALVGSRYAARVTGVDINPRALRFARFNAQLNGIRNARFLQGDLYVPVRGERFDVVLANPPFVPSPTAELGFRDGGARGEEVLARVVADAADHLEPDGRLHLVSDLVDIGDYRRRLAAWWRGGPVEQVLLHTADRDELLFSVPHSYAPFGQSFADYNRELERWVENFRGAGLGAVNFGYLLLQRLPRDSESGYHTRVVHSPQRPIHDRVTRFLELLARLRRPDCGDSYLRINPRFQLRSESPLCGEPPPGHLLHAGDDPWYTTYAVDKTTVDLLRTIARSAPHLGAFLHGDYREQVLDLLCKGILELSSTPPLRPATPGADIPPPPLSISEAPTPIRELESKTTPTCLSSYMKR